MTFKLSVGVPGNANPPEIEGLYRLDVKFDYSVFPELITERQIFLYSGSVGRVVRGTIPSTLNLVSGHPGGQNNLLSSGLGDS